MKRKGFWVILLALILLGAQAAPALASQSEDDKALVLSYVAEDRAIQRSYAGQAFRRGDGGCSVFVNIL